jgi:hypothetical protein
VARGFHHAVSIVRSSKKEKLFSPFFGTQFAAHCSPTPLRAKLDPTGGLIQQRHAVAFAKQVERRCQNIKGRPALPAARPFFIHVVRFTIPDIVYYPFRDNSGN